MKSEETERIEPKVVFAVHGYQLLENGAAKRDVMRDGRRMSYVPKALIAAYIATRAKAEYDAHTEGMREAAKLVCIDCRLLSPPRKLPNGLWRHEDVSVFCKAQEIHAIIERRKRER